MILKNVFIYSLIIIGGLLFDLNNLFAEPNVSNVSGAIVHKGVITVIGRNFGTKSPAAPLIWDDCEKARVNDPSALSNEGTGAVRNDGGVGWNYVRPQASQMGTGGSDYAMAYRSSWNNVSQAHSRSTKYMAAGHFEACADTSNPCNTVYVQACSQTPTNTIFAMWYLRLSDEWRSVPINGPNYKEFYLGDNHCAGTEDRYSCYWAVATGPSPFKAGNIELSTSCYSGLCSSDPIFASGQDFTSIPNPSEGWVHREVNARYNPGYLAFKSDNKNTAGSPVQCANVDLYAGTRLEMIQSFIFGGYARALLDGGKTDNRMKRYMDDLYMDTTWSRVMLGNNISYEDCTIVEPQIPSAWNGTGDSITCTVNLGKLPASGKAYLFVFDAANTHNATGFELTIGAESAPRPDAPANLVILPQQ